MKAKRDAFAPLGWTVWKVGAAGGAPYAKKKIPEGRNRDVTIGAKRRGVRS